MPKRLDTTVQLYKRFFSDNDIPNAQVRGKNSTIIKFVLSLPPGKLHLVHRYGFLFLGRPECTGGFSLTSWRQSTWHTCLDACIFGILIRCLRKLYLSFSCPVAGSWYYFKQYLQLHSKLSHLCASTGTDN